MFNRTRFKYAGLWLWVASTGCRLWESDANEAVCGAFDSKHDGERCRCDSECKARDDGGFCFGEAQFGYAHGYCFHKCTADDECGEGFMCFQNNCMAQCSSSRDCEPTRECGLPGENRISGCVPRCNEAADCESGNCNLYSGRCLPEGESPEGRGLNAECSEDEQCRSNNCRDGRCRTTCLSKTMVCPEDGVCEERGGWCQSKAAAPDVDAGLECSDEDAGAVCQNSK